MPRDQRLYMTFPNDFWMHPNIAPRSVEAKWVFVELNGYSRMQNLDGSIPAVMAERMWSPATLSELCDPAPLKPLLTRVGDVYVINDYAEHQQTTAQHDELSKARSEAGSRGARKRWNGKPMASAIAKRWQDDGKRIAEIEIETELTTPNGVVTRARNRKPETPLPANWQPKPSHVQYATDHQLDGRHEEAQFRAHAAANDRRQRDWDAAFRMWLGNAKQRKPGSTRRPGPDARAAATLALSQGLKEVEP